MSGRVRVFLEVACSSRLAEAAVCVGHARSAPRLACESGGLDVGRLPGPANSPPASSCKSELRFEQTNHEGGEREASGLLDERDSHAGERAACRPFYCQKRTRRFLVSGPTFCTAIVRLFQSKTGQIWPKTAEKTCLKVITEVTIIPTAYEKI
jgi:hypothetical protein